MKVVNVSNKRCVGSGVFGQYYKLSKYKGIKILTMYASRKLNSAIIDLTHASDEAMAIKKAQKSKMTPKLYTVCVAQKGKYFYPAIMMEHLHGYVEFYKVLRRYSDQELRFNKNLKLGKVINAEHLYSLLRKRLSDRVGGFHYDMHWNNVLVKHKNNMINSIRIVDLASLKFEQESV